MSKLNILKTWENRFFSKKLEKHFGKGVSLNEEKIVCLKETKKSSVWKLIINFQGKSLPMILKILPSPDAYNNRVEIEMYQNTPVELKSFIPQIYHIEQNIGHGETWILMQYVYTAEKEWKMFPGVFEKIIPTLSLLHARTHEQVFNLDKQMSSKFIPIYKSNEGLKVRKRLLKSTEKYLEQAFNSPDLKDIIKPMYKRIKKCLSQGPLNFPELEDAGHSIIHGDPHMINICLQKNNPRTNDDLVFIDWESAEYTSNWFDLGHLLMLIEFRPDWHNEEEAIIKSCVTLYTAELKKNGIVFNNDPIELYKKAYVQRILERWLFLQLRNALRDKTNESAKILIPRYLDKLDRWGRELDLF